MTYVVVMVTLSVSLVYQYPLPLARIFFECYVILMVAALGTLGTVAIIWGPMIALFHVLDTLGL